nr:berberine bridge enzyme-like 8 [Ipomoea batatas]
MGRQYPRYAFGSNSRIRTLAQVILYNGLRETDSSFLVHQHNSSLKQRDELQNEPNMFECFAQMHKKNDGMFVDERSKRIVEEIQAERNQLQAQMQAHITTTYITHIQSSILCAKEHDIQMKIRSGGHDFEGLSYVSDMPFFILDMFNFRSVNVNIEDETAWVEVGAILGEVYYAIANKSNVHGFPAGVCPTVGVGGHISGGGYGNMMRKYGLTVDNIIDAKLVDVNGHVLDRKSMGEDLFWAVTGAGASSFGVVTSYKIKLVRVPPRVTVFRVTRTNHQNATSIVYRHQLVSSQLDKNLFIRLSLGVANSTTHHPGDKTISATFIALFLGDSKTLLSTMNEDFPELGLTKDDCKEMTWIESVLFYTQFPPGTPKEALLNRSPQGNEYTNTYFKIKSDYLQTPMPQEGIDFIFKKMVELERVALTFNPQGGRMAEIPSTAKPFPHRLGNIALIQYAINWNKEEQKAAGHYIDLTRQL